jgi:hypothetical protein
MRQGTRTVVIASAAFLLSATGGVAPGKHSFHLGVPIVVILVVLVAVASLLIRQRQRRS